MLFAEIAINRIPIHIRNWSGSPFRFRFRFKPENAVNKKQGYDYKQKNTWEHTTQTHDSKSQKNNKTKGHFLNQIAKNNLMDKLMHQ